MVPLHFFDTVCQHHDIAVLPNGNVLALAWRSYPAARGSPMAGTPNAPRT